MASKRIWTGSCLCRAVVFRIEGEPDWPHYCSCTICQKWSGGPVLAWVDFPLSGLTWVKSTPKLVRTTPKTQRGFCSDCGSGLFALDDGSDKICMTIGAIDQSGLLVPESHSHEASAPRWLCLEIPLPKAENNRETRPET